ncbi:hypothetical protein EOD12_21845 [Mesorhizobium sp. M7A.T.Ca.TU.009.02.1.1]|nr:hypothetical protein EOD15_23585 [Mesorhizobium sp. M7A.T.Ca.US.000.02.2.1]RUT88146.1 hypothetical protein EOD14_07850 [Mesorhizobium sp. M7A.T.Ca.US.000.02.1.1]RUT99460.1 hypothetical protein EOD12_21845 [Mesorhizobium sp. M7A.T.Ca.TU.009.02.1.1]RUU60845.1 hypothetical protein EOC99_21000 [Mesorhizobium sp. M7A.T.Ca.TU.009.01.1.1]RUU84546.1 hypothetical protein EOD03_11905 [Mesorhizobium sp. M7A.T.Ca.TU.009.01.1.2]
MLPAGIGENINGPSLVEMPAWLPNRLGKYYLYFANHKGKYIRLAYADKIEGPYTIYEPGTLRLDQCAPCQNHVASPDVHIDEATKTIRMYFHAPSRFSGGKQMSFVAISKDGLHFSTTAEELGIYYFRVFERAGVTFALGKARLYRSYDAGRSFVGGPAIFSVPGSNFMSFNEPGNIRHTAVLVQGNTLQVYFTRQGDAPEAILRGDVDMTKPWTQWALSNVEPVLKPETDWEGANLPVIPSDAGEAARPVNALRDPAIFEHGGQTYLLYTVAGEQGIALAKITPN